MVNLKSSLAAKLAEGDQVFVIHVQRDKSLLLQTMNQLMYFQSREIETGVVNAFKIERFRGVLTESMKNIYFELTQHV